MKYIILLLVLTACSSVGKTFVMPTVTTSEEERHVLVAVPVIPVYIDTIK